MVLLTLASGAPAQAAAPGSLLPSAVRLHLVSWHDRGEFENVNLGLALRWKGGPTVGGFHNSFGRASWYAGLIVPLVEKRAFQLELMTGVISGYSESSPVDLVVVPTLGLRLSPQSSLQVVFMPRFVIPANVVHVMFERRLGSRPSDPARQ